MSEKNAEEWFRDGKRYFEFSSGGRRSGRVVEQNNRGLTQACDAFERCLALDASHYEAKKLRGTALLQLDRYEEALDTLISAEAQRPGNVDVQFAAAECLSRMEKYSQAIEMFQKVHATRPDDVETIVRIADLATKLSNHGLAVHAWRQVLASPMSTPAHSYTRARVALSLLRLRTSESFNAFTELLEEEWWKLRARGAHDDFFRDLLSYLSRHLTDVQNAHRAVGKWAANREGEFEPYLCGEVNQARATFLGEAVHSLRAQEPKQRDTWWKLGDALEKLGDLVGARDAYQRAHEASPEFIPAQDSIRRINEELDLPWTLMATKFEERSDYVFRKFASYAEAKEMLDEMVSRPAKVHRFPSRFEHAYWLKRGWAAQPERALVPRTP